MSRKASELSLISKIEAHASCVQPDLYSPRQETCPHHHLLRQPCPRQVRQRGAHSALSGVTAANSPGERHPVSQRYTTPLSRKPQGLREHAPLWEREPRNQELGRPKDHSRRKRKKVVTKDKTWKRGSRSTSHAPSSIAFIPCRFRENFEHAPCKAAQYLLQSLLLTAGVTWTTVYLS